MKTRQPFECANVIVNINENVIIVEYDNRSETFPYTLSGAADAQKLLEKENFQQATFQGDTDSVFSRAIQNAFTKE